jgi:RNA polymerase sigma factor (sigma-70 family)
MGRERSTRLDETGDLGQPAGTGFTRPRPGVNVSGVGLKELYEAERSGLFLFLRSLGADNQEADDAVQEAFAAVLERWDTIRNPRPYLYTTAMNKYYRANARNRETPASNWMRDQAEPLSSGDIAEFNELEERVRAAVAALPARQRQVMALTMAGFKPAQIAQQLGSEEAAVRQNQARARDNIARKLGIDRRNRDDRP